MPKRKRSRNHGAWRRARRGLARRGRRARRRSSRYSAGVLSGFPRSKIVRLRYVDTHTLDANAATLSTKLYRCNSIYDPQYAVGGQQPLGHDQWATFYAHYVVIGAKITTQFTTATGNIGVANACGIFLSASASIPTTLVNMLEQGNTVSRAQPLSGINMRTLSRGFSAKKFFNVTNVKDNTDRLGAAFGADPDEDAYFCVFVGAIDATANTPPVNCITTIDYLVVVSEPKQLLQS